MIPRRAHSSLVGPTVAGGAAARPRTVLAIGGSDPSGGAGIQADLKALRAQGVYGMAAIAALTVQDTTGVHGVQLVGADLLYAQVRAVLRDLPVDAVKVGMLGSPEGVRALAAALDDEGWGGPLVLDPVGVAKGGRTLQGPDTVEALVGFAERATVVTPNLEEAWAFPRGLRLVKGGHGTGEIVIDRLVGADGRAIAEWTHPRLASPHTHGTGCVLASTIAARLALGDDLIDACDLAIGYVQRQIRCSSAGLGLGRGPLWQVD